MPDLFTLFKEFGGSAVSSAVFLLVYLLIRYVATKVSAKNRVVVAEITATGQRDQLSVEATAAAFAAIGHSLELSRKEEDQLRVERDRAWEKIYEEREAYREQLDKERKIHRDQLDKEVSEVRLELIREQHAKIEAAQNEGNAKNLLQGALARFEAEKRSMIAELEALRWREKHMVAWILQTRPVVARLTAALLALGVTDIPEPPPIPYWIVQSASQSGPLVDIEEPDLDR